MRILWACSLTLFCSSISPAASIPTLIDFEKAPSITTPQPTTLTGPPQTITVPGIATITGGAVVANAASRPTQTFATLPNTYGTSNINGVTGFPRTEFISIDPAYIANEVSFVLFNSTGTNSVFTVTAFDGAAQVITMDQIVLGNGYVTFDLLSGNITSVAVAENNLTLFNFYVDSIALNQSVQAATATPEPQTYALLGGGFGLLALLRRRKKAISCLMILHPARKWNI